MGETAKRDAWIHDVKVWGGVRYGYTTVSTQSPGSASRCLAHWTTKRYAKKKAAEAGFNVVPGRCPLPPFTGKF